MQVLFCQAINSLQTLTIPFWKKEILQSVRIPIARSKSVRFYIFHTPDNASHKIQG